jgi:hypothetical protein
MTLTWYRHFQRNGGLNQIIFRLLLEPVVDNIFSTLLEPVVDILVCPFLEPVVDIVFRLLLEPVVVIIAAYFENLSLTVSFVHY